MVFTKTMFKYEFDLTKLAAESGVAPKFNFEEKDGKFMVTFNLPLYTLADHWERTQNIDDVDKKIQKLIDKMHNAGIYHGNLDSNNILFDSANRKVYAINFDESFEIKDIDQEIIDEADEKFRPDENFMTTQDLLNFEKIYYRRDLIPERAFEFDD